LRRPADFSRFVGTTITLKSHAPVSGARRHRGRLLEADGDGVALDVDGERRQFPYEGIASARTVFEWGPPEKPKPGTPKPGSKGEAGAARAAASQGRPAVPQGRPA
jgi:ribosome maturation factor RimP